VTIIRCDADEDTSMSEAADAADKPPQISHRRAQPHEYLRHRVEIQVSA
jgi:hypothetical protein